MKLIVAAQIDYPAATEFLVSFADQWELVKTLNRPESHLYVAVLPNEPVEVTRDHFHGLPPEINLALGTYRQYQLFEPWPEYTLGISLEAGAARGSVTGASGFTVVLKPFAEAQVWKGPTVAVLWDCIMREVSRPSNWLEELTAFWKAVEVDTDVAKIYTLPVDAAFEVGYKDFLIEIGYSPDKTYTDWWSKSFSRQA